MNHVIIGLGGTGGKIIRALRKQIYSEFRKEDADGANIAYLYIDSSDEFMKRDDPSWKVLGTSLQLHDASLLRISSQDLAARLENIDNYPGIKPWIGDRAVWNDILGSIVGVALGGQKRRLGRFLFACNADAFRVRLQSLVKQVQADGSTNVTFHILAGLAGGTGSGSLIDVIAQTRALYSDTTRYRILPYLLLPDQYPDPNWDSGNYHSNGYAAALELNALSTTSLKPFDVTGAQGRLSLKDPFTGTYLFCNENENGYQANVDKELPQIVADFLFQKIVIADKIGWRSLERMENAENGDGTPELAANGKSAERAKRFLTFGIKRITIPEEEIEDYLSLNFARQAIQQLRFNNWQDGSGYVDQQRNLDVHSLVRQADIQARWLLTDGHVTLGLPILQQDDPQKRWKPLAQEWNAVMPTFKSIVREQDRAGWLDELAKLTEKRYQEDFRNAGVAAFYRTKLKSKRDMAREIRVQVERALFNDWRTGVRALGEISRVIDATIEMINERLVAADTQISGQVSATDECERQLLTIKQRWAQLGFFSKSVFGKPDQLLDEYAVQLEGKYTALTRVEGWGFAKQLLAEVVTELSDLKAQVDAIAADLKTTLTRVEDNIDQRLKDKNSDDLRSHIIRFYEPDAVRSVTRKLSIDETEQRTHTNALRQTIADRLGDMPTFEIFRKRMSAVEFADIINANAETSALQAHTNMAAAGKERIIGVSIIEKLKERYGGDKQALGSYIGQLVKQAGSFLRFNPLEVNKAAPGVPVDAKTLIAKTIIILPKAPQHAEFIEAIKQAFRQAQTGDIEFLDSDGRANEITMISIKNLFPVRYVSQIAFLKERYDRRIETNPTRLKLELHTEGDGLQYPRVFVTTGEESRRAAVPTLLLADALGLVRSADTKSGRAMMQLQTRYADGFENLPVDLGESRHAAPQALDVIALASLQDVVSAQLATVAAGEPRKALEASVLARVESVRALVGNDANDSKYREFIDGGRAALKQIRGE